MLSRVSYAAVWIPPRGDAVGAGAVWEPSLWPVAPASVTCASAGGDLANTLPDSNLDKKAHLIFP